MSEVEVVIDMPAEYSSMVFGQFDEYAKVIEKTLKVTIIVRDSSVKVIGAEVAVQRASGVLNYLYELSKRGNQITRQNVEFPCTVIRRGTAACCYCKGTCKESETSFV